MTIIINAIVWLIVTLVLALIVRWAWNKGNEQMSEDNKVTPFKKSWVVTICVFSMIIWGLNNFSWFMPTNEVAETNHEREQMIKETLAIPDPEPSSNLVSQAALDEGWSNKVQQSQIENDDIKSRFLKLPDAK